MSTKLNDEQFISKLKDEFNRGMIEAAEPFLKEALNKIEQEMRAKLASMIIARINYDVNFETYGQELRISVKTHKNA